MIRRWVTLEQEVSQLARLINQGSDQDLVDYLQPLSPDHIRWTVDHVSCAGDTVLHLAAVRQRLSGLRVMLHNQADANGRDGHGRSPLHACLYHNSLSSARLLISFGADVNETVCRQTREFLIHSMIKANRPLAVELLVEMGTSLKAVTKDGDTPLHFVARYNRLQMARFLTSISADVNSVNLKQETPLHVALVSHSLDVAKVLVKNKASVTVKDDRGMTSLHLAVIVGSLELARLILKANSTQVNGKESVLGRTPLLLACSSNNPKMVALLLSYGADTTLTNFYRKSVLHVAATSGSAKVLWTILRQALNPNLLATNNQTPLHCAVIRGETSIVKILLGYGVKADMKDLAGNTALHLAAQAGNNDLINVLIQHGTQVNLTNMLQQTPLHLASMAGHANTCALLVQAGCDQNILDLHQTKAGSYLDKFDREPNRRTDTETRITREADRRTDTETRITREADRGTDTETRITREADRRTDTEIRITREADRRTDTETRITREADRRTDTETRITREAVGVRFCKSDHQQLQGIQESAAGEDEMESIDINNSNFWQKRDNKSNDEDEMQVIATPTVQTRPDNHLESNKAAEETINSDRLTNKCSTHVRFKFQQQATEKTRSDSDDEASDDEMADSQRQGPARTRQGQTRGRISRSKNNKTSGRKARGVQGHGNGGDNDVIMHEGTDHRKRKQGVII